MYLYYNKRNGNVKPKQTGNIAIFLGLLSNRQMETSREEAKQSRKGILMKDLRLKVD